MTNTEFAAPWLKVNRLALLNVYVTLVGTIGCCLVVVGLLQIPTHAHLLNFALLVLLAATAAIATTSIPVSDKAGITYHIGSAISIAAVPLFGVFAAGVIAAVEDLCTWVVKPADGKTWKKTWRQLFFNLGMHAIAVVLAGSLLLWGRGWLGAETLLGSTVPWLLAALVYEEVNLWLLIGVLRLQHGPTIKPLAMWREDRWATQIDIILMTIGGGLLAFAMQQYDWLGVLMFFLPIGLSAFAFRLYVRQMQAHLDNLENIVSERTSQLAERTHELAEINEQKDAFLSVLTHDMMTPLANIQLCAEIIREDAQLSADSQHLAQLMLHSQKTLYTLVRNILDLARLQSAGALPVNKAGVDLDQILLHTVNLMQLEANEKKITLRYKAAHENLWLHADAHQLERVFLNLISNAVKYTPVGGAVQVIARVQQQHTLVDVQDNGYGIPADELPHLFERFRRIKQLEDKASGTGLGLAITKALIEQHDGEITVVSREGQGSTFTVRLPLTG